MNLLSVLLPFAVLLLAVLPAFFEILRRKDRGPRAIPKQTIYHGKPELIPRDRSIGCQGIDRSAIAGIVSVPRLFTE